MYFDQPVTRFIQVDALVMVLDQHKPKGFYFSGESHDFWEAVFVYDGHLTATADERVYQLSRGMLLLHKPMEFHRIWSAEDQESRFVNLSFRAGGMGIRRLEHCCFNLDEEQQKHLWEVIDAFRHTMELQSALDRQRCQMSGNLTAARLEGFLLELMEKGTSSPRTLSGEEARYARIVSVMKENCHRSLSLEELAGECEMSVSNMKRIFGCFSDMGVGKYFLSLKMRRAMELLDSGMRASQVAESLDFSETSYFYTVFKRETGMTPTQYRKMKAQK